MSKRVDAAVVVDKLSKTYPDGTEALKSFDLEVPKGQLVAIIGPSGAGKSTLMRCINRLVDPTSGRVIVNGHEVTKASRKELRAIRREIGMVFQHFHLVQRLPTVRNVLHGRLGYTSSLRGALGMFREDDVNRALDILATVGLEKQAFKRCSDLSGGQMQRVGIARAMMQDARLILADEPIASLDLSASETVMKHLKDVAVAEGIAALVNLHQVDYATSFADRIVGVRGGELYCDVPTSELTETMVRELYYGDMPDPALEDA